MDSAANYHVYDYLELLKLPVLLSQPWPRYQPKKLDGLRTSHPTYHRELEQAVDILKDYFENATKDTLPLNCLILGPPGAGKTFLAKKLAKSVGKPFKEHNVSLSSDPKSMLEELSRDAGGPKFVFIDEFDVTIGGSSVTRFLLDPITSDRHHQTAFVFSGSYLKNKPILERLNSNLSDFDFTRFLFDLIARENHPQMREHLLQLYQLCCWYQENRQTFTPDADLIQYLSQLHKLRDFLSRINGFIVQIPDLASPMMITEHELMLKRDSEGAQSPDIQLLEPKTAEYVRKFVVDTERIDENKARRFWRFDKSNDAILEFKHMLLTERIGYVAHLLKDYIGRLDKNKKTTYFISRQELNYLIMVPLQHNIRSLKLLIEHCLDQKDLDQKDMVQGRPNPEGLARKRVAFRLKTKSPIFPLHVGKEPYFDSPSSLWAFLTAANGGSGRAGNDVFCGHEGKGKGEDLIRLSQVRGVITLLPIPGNEPGGDEAATFWEEQNRFATSGEELFHGLQLMQDEQSKNQIDCLNGLKICLDLLNDDDSKKTHQHPYLHPLLGRIVGEYTLILNERARLQPKTKPEQTSQGESKSENTFLVDAIDVLETKNKNSGKFPKFLLDERIPRLPRLLCRTDDLRELVLWEKDWEKEDTLTKFLKRLARRDGLKTKSEKEGVVHWK